MPLPIPETGDAITPDWLGAALQRPILRCGARPIGQNESFTGGTLFRLTLGDQTADGPTSVIAKLAPQDPALRALLAGANRQEVRFYDGLTKGKNLPVPRCYHAAFDEHSGASIVLLEDLENARSVPFAKGCSASDAGRVVAAMAQVHAAFWESPETQELSQTPLSDQFDFAAAWAAYPEKLAQILPEMSLPTEFTALGDHLAKHGLQPSPETGPITCLHGDLQADNLLFCDQRALLLDWQFMRTGKGASDLAYFLISSLDPTLRRRLEPSLIARYCQNLSQTGLAHYGQVECQRDYLVSVIGKIFLTVIATVQFDHSSPHKAAWRRIDLHRLLAFCADHQITPECLAS